MQNNSKKDAAPQKVLFIRVDEPIYNAVASLADEDDRSINWMATKLLKSALEQIRKDS